MFSLRTTLHNNVDIFGWDGWGGWQKLAEPVYNPGPEHEWDRPAEIWATDYKIHIYCIVRFYSITQWHPLCSRIVVVRDAGFEPRPLLLTVCCAINKPPHTSHHIYTKIEALLFAQTYVPSKLDFTSSNNTCMCIQ